MAQAVKVMSEETRGAGPSEQKSPGWVDTLLGYPKRFRQFLHDVRLEVKQVTWPTREDVKATTLVVIVTVFVFGVYLFGVDRVASWIVETMLTFFRK